MQASASTRVQAHTHTLRYTEQTEDEALLYNVLGGDGVDLPLAIDIDGDLKPIEEITFSFDSQDCSLGAWREWAPCSATCGDPVTRVRTREVLVEPAGSGAQCPSTSDSMACDVDAVCPTASPTATEVPTFSPASIETGVPSNAPTTAAPTTATPSPTTIAPTSFGTPAPSLAPTPVQTYPPPPAGSVPAPPRFRCPNDCSGHGTCDESRGVCSCEAGWFDGGCETFAIAADGWSANTTELGGRAVLALRTVYPPLATISCTARSSRPEEATVLATAIEFRDVERRKVIVEPEGGGANLEVAQVTLKGTKDLLQDGDQPFDVVVGPCSSTDTRFAFVISMPVAVGFNEHVTFPDVGLVEPKTVSLVGEPVSMIGHSFAGKRSIIMIIVLKRWIHCMCS